MTDILPAPGLDEGEFLRLAASVEARSEHPLAKAIAAAAATRGLALREVTDFEAVTGRGVQATVDGVRVRIGSPNFLPPDAAFPPALEAARDRLEAEGKTVMLVERDGAWAGLLALADEVRPDAKAMIDTLHRSGVQVAMLTGDNPQVANTIARQLGVDKVYAGLMPEDKVTVVREMESSVGPTAMVGDGVNDAPALATASIGIAMGAAGTDVALETADLVLMGDRLELIPYAIKLSKKARRVVWQNLTFSIGVIIVLIISAFAVSLPLPLGVLGHEGSTVIVVLNGLISLLLWPEFQRRRAAGH
jgi:Cd2+/Zn2+-exporting ATPase